MRFIKNIFFVLLLAISSNLSAQLEVSLVGGEAAAGQLLEVDVTAETFNELSSFQFNLVWDSLVMTFVEIKNTTNDFTPAPAQDYDANTNFGTPGEGSIKDGTISTSWTDFNANRSLPEDTRLFTLVLMAVGDDCDMSSLSFTNLEASSNFIETSSSATDGEILVSGTDCGGGGSGGGNDCEDSEDVVISVEETTAASGSNVCLEVTVFNFTDIEAVQSGILWDPTVLEYTGVQNFELPALNASSFNSNNAPNGDMRLLWSEPTGEAPVTVDDGTVIFEICFDVIGDDGDMSAITFDNIGNFEPEVVQNGVGVPYCFDAGKVTVGVAPQDPFVFIASNESGSTGEICVDITSQNFVDLRGYQANLRWDDAVINYTGTQGFNSTLGLTASNFNYTEPPANLKFTWDNLSPTTIPDNEVLFQVCFDIVGDCDEMPSTSVFFFSGSTDNTRIEVINANAETIDFDLVAGSVSITGCEHTCELVAVSQPECPGDSGSITVNVDADDTCNCNWYLNGGTTPIQSTPGNGNCNLSSVGPGNYTFELTNADDEVVCTFDQTLNEPAQITTNPVVTSAGCGDSGSIILNATGGSGTLTYQWTPNVSSGDIGDNLPVGMYTIVITDQNNCSITETQEVSATIDPLEINEANSVVTDPLCAGEATGSIVVAVTGGCPDYTFDWSAGDGTNLLSGTYTVTVTDANGTTSTAEFSLTDPDPLSLTSIVVDATGGNANGSIQIVPSGGTEPYTYTWNPNVSTNDTADNLSAGSYSVTVTDDNGCQQSINDIPVIDTGGNDLNITVSNVQSIDGCSGDATGSIGGAVSGGSGPYTVTLSGPDSQSITLANPENYTFSNLVAGSYTVAVSDSNGETASMENVVITEVAPLSVNVTTGSDLNDCDGFITLDISGGTAPYTFDGDLLEETTENLCQGTYNTVITDANGCEFMVVNATVNGTPNVNCYQARDIITPNGDGFNEFFTFSCINDRPASLEIFDRYGRIVYSNVAYDNSFNGISDTGNILGEGGYMWVLNIDYGNGQREVMKGTLTLLRE